MATTHLSDHGQSIDLNDYRSGPTGACCLEKNIGDNERAFSLALGVGLGLAGLSHGRGKGLALTALGAGLIWRGYTGHCGCYTALGINNAERQVGTSVPARQGVKLEKTIVIERPAADLYRFWRRLENLPQVMRHLKSVRSIDSQHSRWVADGALGQDLEWDAEIINEREDEMLAWASIPGGDIETAGSVHFRPKRDDTTEVTISLKYNPPAGKIGAHFATLLGVGLEAKLDEDLNAFKQTMETGMAPSPQVAD
ncbi:MAG: YgaP-like transmembrane domain [Burkholderiales bacterium]